MWTETNKKYGGYVFQVWLTDKKTGRRGIYFSDDECRSSMDAFREGMRLALLTNFNDFLVEEVMVWREPDKPSS